MYNIKKERKDEYMNNKSINTYLITILLIMILVLAITVFYFEKENSTLKKENLKIQTLLNNQKKIREQLHTCFESYSTSKVKNTKLMDKIDGFTLQTRVLRSHNVQLRHALDVCRRRAIIMDISKKNGSK